MKATRASLRYAKATLAFAEEANSSQKVSDDMQILSSLMKENEELSSVMENPMLAAEKKKVILNELLPDASVQTQELFSLLANNNRMELLGGTCEQYIELFAAQKGEVKAIVTTAIALTPELKQQVLIEAKKLSDKKATRRLHFSEYLRRGRNCIGGRRRDCSRIWTFQRAVRRISFFRQQP